MHSKQDILSSFSELIDVMNELREKCPWDKKQTFLSLRNNTIEEVYELSEALLSQNLGEIKKELGDVLLQIVFYSKIASETGAFDLKDVCDELVKKLIYRHPHIYGNAVAQTPEKVKENWEQLKLKEKDGNKWLLSGVPQSLPSIIKASRMQEKAANVGFDWKQKEQVWNKVKEELSEFENELKSGSGAAKEEEFGDLLFSLINAARLFEINPDNALEKTNKKFFDRFGYIEAEAKKRNKSLKEMTLTQMEELWQEAKSRI